MAYTPQEWRNGDPATPLSAERLLHIESGIADAEQPDPTWATIADKPTTFPPAAHEHPDKADLVDGKVPTSQIPAIALTKPSSVANRAAMLALAAEEGDVAVITAGADKGTYMLGSGASTAFASWIQLAVSAEAPVQSVNGQVGTVTLAATDVGASPTGHTHATADVTGLDAALTGKAPTSHTHAWADVTGKPSTFPPTVGTTATTAKAGDYQPTWAQVSGKPTTFAPAAHDHETADVTGLDAALSSKAATSHTHTIANVTGLQDALDGKQASGSYATASALADLVARVEALEADEGGGV